MTTRIQASLRSRVPGFTLVELLLVLFILSTLALVTTAVVDGANEQLRFDMTKSRLALIRDAVVGNASQTVNGEPMLNGFVADLGRLPDNIRELIEGDGMPAWQRQDIYWPVDSSNVVATLYGGWRGPYLEALPESGISAVRAYRDGWGTPGDAPNYGWIFGEHTAAEDTACRDVSTTPAVAGTLKLQSCGMDGLVGGAGVYDVDYPAAGNLVEATDWVIDLQGPTFNVQIHGPVEEANLKLLVFYLADGVQEWFESGEFLSVSGVQTQQHVVSFSNAAPNEEISMAPMGKYAALILCSDETVFDGICPGITPSGVSAYYFTLTPRATLPITIPWNIY